MDDTTAPDTSLDMLNRLPARTHLCHFYQDTAEFLEASISFLKARKDGTRKFLWIFPEDMDKDFLLSEIEALWDGASISTLPPEIELISSNDWYLDNEHISLESLCDKWKSKIDAMYNSGFKEICVLSSFPSITSGFYHSSYLLGETLCELVNKYPMTLMCQYRVSNCSNFDIIDISTVHEYILTKRQGVWLLKSNTVHKKQKEELESSRDFYLTLFEEFPALIWRSGLDASCNYFNKRWLSFTGRTIEQEMGNGWAEGIHPADFDRCVNHYMTYFKARSPFSMEYRLKHNDGEYRWILDMGMPFYDLNKNFAGYIGSCYDITEYRNIETHLREVTNDAQQATLSKSLFLSNMSHEIRTPMSGVFGMLELLSLTALDEKQRNLVDKAKTSAEILLRIINDILDLSKIEAGKLEFEKRYFDLKMLIETTVETLRPFATKKNLSLNTTISLDLPQLILGDPVRISQIIINLANNAIKFTDKGNVNILVELVSETAQSVTLKFCIEDTGIGIAAEQYSNLFQNFSQLSNISSRKYGGTGLGLAISKQLVSQMGGDLLLESQEGVGSSFYFSVTFEKQCDVCNSSSDSSNSFVKPFPNDKGIEILEFGNPGVLKSKPHVLVVDDDEINQFFIKEVLHGYFDLDIAANGQEALDFYENNRYAIILMDVQMPVLDGFETTEIIRKMELKTQIHTPIIGLTAYAMISDKEKCIVAGMDSYLSKPIDAPTLLKTLLSTLK